MPQPNRTSRSVEAISSDRWLLEAARQAGHNVPDDTPAEVPAWTILGQCGLTEAATLQLACETSATPAADLSAAGPAVAPLMRDTVARRYEVVPVALRDGVLEVATTNPLDSRLERDLAFACGRRITLACASPAAIAEARTAIYGVIGENEAIPSSLGMAAIDGLPSAPERLGAELEISASRADERFDATAGASTVDLVEKLLADALVHRSSDVHFEPQDGTVLVRYRVDGVLQDRYRVPASQAAGLIRRLKIMAGMDITDSLRPQDGRASVLYDGRHVDLRVSTLPLGAHLEKIVVRTLDGRALNVPLDQTGFSSNELRRLQRMLEQPEGLILVTGPTGSGKTTTLYAALRHIQRRELNIITVEDPVEYRIAGITQVQINEKARMTFAASLRSILRQDPDVVLVGEIRDAETAGIAVKASMTGHLVLSTLHTADAVATVDRLYGMDVETTQLATALKGIVSQRLVRRLCPDCARPMRLDELPTHQQKLLSGRDTSGMRAPVGCAVCNGTGYSGRMLVAELFLVTPAVQRAIARRADITELRAAGREAGMTTMWDSGVERVLQGTTSLHELLDNVPAPLEDVADAGESQADIDALLAQLLAGNAPSATPAAATSLATGAAASDIPRLTVARGPSEPTPVGPLRVLLVDDDATARRELARALTAEGLSVIEAADGEAALSYARRLRPDVVLTEIALPKLDGPGLVQALAAEPCRLLIHTTQRDVALLDWLRELGAEDVVTKGVDARMLASRLGARPANAA